MSNNKYQKVDSSESQDEISEEQQSIMAHVSNIPSTHSSQQLMNDAESVLTEEDAKSLSRRTRQTETSITKTQLFTVAVLCFINLINYMDRFTIAGEFLWNFLSPIQRQSVIKSNKTKFRERFRIFRGLGGFLWTRNCC
jgi:hypothetical protein